MKILHVLDHSLPVQSGYAFRSAAIIREQRRMGWETVQVTGPKQGVASADAETVAGIEYLRTMGSDTWIAALPAGAHLDVVRRLRTRLRAVIADENPDLIQAHSPCLNGLAALRLGRPLVYELRSSWEDAAVSSGVTTEGSLRYRASQWLETLVLRRADGVSVICEGLRREVTTRGVSDERIAVIPNAMDTEEIRAPAIDAAAAKARWGLQGRAVIGFVGSFFAWEGLGLLIEALPAIRAVREDVALLLVGDGNDGAVLRKRAASLQGAGLVVFAGVLPHEAVGEAYAAMDILAYPRLPMRLTELVTPLKPLEAMAFGKPLIASDVGGHREQIDDGRTGILFRAGDATALAAAATRVLQDPDLAARLRDEGRHFVRTQLTWARSAGNYEALFDRVLSGSPP